MRLAYICADPGVPVFGRKGCSVHVQEVIRALQAYGIRIDLFATSLGGDLPPDLEPIRLHPLPTVPKGDLASRERAALSANDELRIALEHAGPFDVIYERYSLWSFAGMDYARTWRLPGLLEVNAPLLEEQAEHRGLADRAGAQRVAERAFGAATWLLPVSEAIAMYLEQFPNVQGRVQVIPNGVDPRRFPAGLTPSRPAQPGTFTVGFVGTLKPWHDLAVLVEAFAMLHQRDPRSRLLIVGDGPARESLLADIAARQLSEVVQLTGAVPPDQIPGLLASLDVAVAPYPARRPFYFSPLKVYEYMAAGRGVVTSRLGQLADLIEDGVNGLLYPAGDAVALAAALDRLRRWPELRARLGQAARATVMRNHSWDSVARRVLDLAKLESAVGARNEWREQAQWPRLHP